MSQPQKRFVPVRPDDITIVAPYNRCQVLDCPVEGYPYTFSYGQTGKVTFFLCEKHREIVGAGIWAVDQLGLIADGGCAHAQKQPVGQLGQRQMVACQQCGTLFII